MEQSKTWACILADTRGPEFTPLEPFAQYGNGGFGYRDDSGRVIIAPVTNATSDHLVHLAFFTN
ncbi:hypothetical protein HW452_11110 [Halomonas aquamarina]|uniref:Uncharacterized protein n=1 Tax=Vreelandella aquamarina TaxID=77097 RepID=A0ACC5VV51_9GAMM|nr:hypothetical protein [Halomonas aquamarina]MBZ5488071.1 hypothetical protein [Halomonas aquamarina]